MRTNVSGSTVLTMPAYVARESDEPNARTPVYAGEDLRCFHCGVATRGASTLSLFVGGISRTMCCVGCQAVTQTIVDAGLEAFYDHRDDYSVKPADSSSSALPFADSATSAAFSRAADNGAPDQTENVVEYRETQLYLSNVTCAACIWLAEKTLSRLGGIQTAWVNQATLSASVKFDARRLTVGDIVSALDRVGLEASPAADGINIIARTQAARHQLVDLGIAVLCMMQVMMLTVPLYFADPAEISLDAQRLMGWASWLITIPAMAWAGRSIFSGAARQLSAGHAGMDTPVALALLLTFATSTYALWSGAGHLYFDAITMFIALLLGARWLENGIRQRAIAKIERMANPRPQIVSCLPQFPASDVRVDVSAATLRAGDVVEVPPGELIPADGSIVRGETEVDESLMTGESLPIVKRVAQDVIGGTVNIASPILIRVDRAGEKGTLARLAKLTENGLAGRPAFHGVADIAARYVAPATILLALIAGVVWLMIDASRSLEVVVAVLVVTCPCALALAAPAATAAALGAMANSGLLVVRNHFLETLAGVTDVVFDKTGTITTGRMTLGDVMLTDVTDGKSSCGMDRAAVLAICGALEAGSIHPVAHSIRAAIAEEPLSEANLVVASSLVSRAGAGIEGIVNGACYRFGKPEFALDPANTSGDFVPPLSALEHTVATTLVLCVQDRSEWRQLAVLAFTDTVRADVQTTVRALTQRGIAVHLLSGDSPSAVMAIARAADIRSEHVRAAQTAEDKRNYVLDLQALRKRVVAIGDGVNDAPMLTAANASIGLASGAALTRLSADAVLDEGKQSLFATIAGAFTIAHRAMAITRQNFVWALSYNAIAVPLAFMGWVNPFVAALGMAVSSLIVVVNASRIYSWNRSGS
jgi:P-type Cu2+ transporter